MKLLVTGGAGFIGSHFIRYVLQQYPDWEVCNLDKLSYAGNLDNLKDIFGNRKYKFIKGDIADKVVIDKILSEHYDAIINLAAESHVDRSILDSSPFIDTNIKGTQVLLEGVRKYRIPRFIQASTDEVYGSISEGNFTEQSPLAPNNPYAASKAAADLLCLAYTKTYHTPVIITRCTNSFGPNQFPEKLIPLTIINSLENRYIYLYGDGLNVREWIFIIDHCRALDAVLQSGRPGSIYNIGSGCEKTNLDVVSLILEYLGKPRSFIRYTADRPGHDRRYSLDASRINDELGWRPSYYFENALIDTINWYLENREWWQRIKSGEYTKGYERFYLR